MKRVGRALPGLRHGSPSRAKPLFNTAHRVKAEQGGPTGYRKHTRSTVALPTQRQRDFTKVTTSGGDRTRLAQPNSGVFHHAFILWGESSTGRRGSRSRWVP